LFKKIEENVKDCSGDYTRSFVYMLIAQFNYFIWPFILLCLLNFLIMINIWKRTRKMTRLKSCQSKSSPNMLTNRKLSSSNCQGTNLIRASLIGPYSPTIPKKCQSNESIVDVRILQKLNHEIKETRHLAQRDLRIKRDRKAARSLFILVLVFLIFLFPYVICSTASTAGFHISPTILEISFWLLWLNSTCNPFLYPFIQTKYRRAYAKLFRSCFKQSI
jgi:histamine receptor H3